SRILRDPKLLFVEGARDDVVFVEQRFGLLPERLPLSRHHKLQFQQIAGRDQSASGALQSVAQPLLVRFCPDNGDNDRRIYSDHLGRPYSSYMSSTIFQSGSSGGMTARMRLRISSTSRSRLSRSSLLRCSAVRRLASNASATASVMVVPFSLASLRAFSATALSLMFSAPIGASLVEGR